jgi:arylsulfatase A
MANNDAVSRRDFIKGVLALGGALTVGGLGYRVVKNQVRRDYRPETSRKYLDSISPPNDLSDLPNIIIVFTDDLGYGDLGISGSPAIQTPNIDKMATEGARLINFYATAPLCSPSRAGLLTGRYPIRTMVTSALYPTGSLMNPVLDVAGFHTLGVRGIPEDEILLPEILQHRGYRTGLVGKWHLGDRTPHLPLENGFDEFYGALYSNDMGHYRIYRDDKVEIDHPVDQNQLTQLMTAEALRFIESNADHPFFLFLAHPMPHEPIHASQSFRGISKAGLYGDCVEEIDWSMGELFKSLKSKGIDERTLVIFTSDNGPWWQGNPGNYRGRKNLPFEGGYLVPFIARWPGTIPAGVENDEMCMNFDLFSLSLGVASIQPPNDRIIDGVDILPLLKGEAITPHEILYFYKGKNLFGVRQNDWKYLRRHMTDNGGYATLSQGPFLFNLQTDPNESYSLIESNPEVARNLSMLLDDFDADIKKNIRGWK